MNKLFKIKHVGGIPSSPEDPVLLPALLPPPPLPILPVEVQVDVVQRVVVLLRGAVRGKGHKVLDAHAAGTVADGRSYFIPRGIQLL